jgi:hypothetical protein
MAKKIRVWDGSAWQDVAPSLPYTAIHSAQASMPATGVDGQVWLDTDGTLAGQDFVPLSGGTMTGNLNTPSINDGGIAGQNYFINGGMDFWQRGTTFTGSSGSVLNLADRWKSYDISSTSRSTDVPTGQGFQYSISFSAAAGGSYPRLQYRMPSEEAVFLAGKTVTFSFWAKNGGGTATFFAEQQIPTTANSFDGNTTNLGGTTFATSGNFSTSWQKYTWTTTVHSTTATNGMTFHLVRDPSSASTTLITGLKMELGNQATPFTRAGLNIAGELAACQRYYYRIYAEHTYGILCSVGHANTASQWYGRVQHPIAMRIAPSSMEYGGSFRLTDGPAGYTTSVVALSGVNNKYYTEIAASTSGMTQYRTVYLQGSNDANSYIAFSAEL